MKINGVNPSKIMNIYSSQAKNVEKKAGVSQKDSIEISSLGKNLSSYSLDDKFVNSDEKIETIKNQIANGTYSRDSKLVAAKILEAIRGK